MVFELAGDAAFDGPMPGIVDSRSHLIGDQSSLDDEKLDGEDADIVECAHHPFQIDSGAALEARICKRCNAVVQDGASMFIARQRIDPDVPRRGTRAHDGYFAGKWLKFLVDQP